MRDTSIGGRLHGARVVSGNCCDPSDANGCCDPTEASGCCGATSADGSYVGAVVQPTRTVGSGCCGPTGGSECCGSSGGAA